MRRLIALVVIVVLGWSAWWFAGARGTEAAIRAWLDAQRVPGRVAEAAVDTRGYPMRFDTVLSDLRLGDPDGVLWEAGEVQLLMLAYAPNRAVVAWPGPQRIATPAGALTLEAARATASARVGVDPDVPLTDFTGVARALTAAGAGWSAGIDEARLAVRAAEGSDLDHRVGLLVAGTALPPQLFAAVPALEGLLPRRLERVRLDAVATLDAPLDRHAAEAPPRLAALEVAAAEVDWGALRLRAGPGRIDVGRDGRPYGRVEMRVDGWQRLIEGLVATGVLPARQAPLAIASLTVLAAGDRDGAIDLPLILENGRMRLGPVPLGPAPMLPPPG